MKILIFIGVLMIMLVVSCAQQESQPTIQPDYRAIEADVPQAPPQEYTTLATANDDFLAIDNALEYLS